MVYRIEAVIPVEIGVPSIRTQHLNLQTNEIEQRLALDLLEEVTDQADAKSEVYRRQMVKHFNKKVKHKMFRQGDLVL